VGQGRMRISRGELCGAQGDASCAAMGAVVGAPVGAVLDAVVGAAMGAAVGRGGSHVRWGQHPPSRASHASPHPQLEPSSKSRRAMRRRTRREPSGRGPSPGARNRRFRSGSPGECPIGAWGGLGASPASLRAIHTSHFWSTCGKRGRGAVMSTRMHPIDHLT